MAFTDNFHRLHSLKVRLDVPAMLKLIKILLTLITGNDVVTPAVASKAANLLYFILKKSRAKLDGVLIIDYVPLLTRIDAMLFGPRRLPPSLAEM